MAFIWSENRLYLIPFLHQTTTLRWSRLTRCWLYLIPFLHQTTTFAIKGEREPALYLIPFLHQTTTWLAIFAKPFELYLIPFLHQTTTCGLTPCPIIRCILFHFYIKPQLNAGLPITRLVVSYSISTSNHNHGNAGGGTGWLYLIPFLHQTTTFPRQARYWGMLYLIPFLHQTTTQISTTIFLNRCILFHFYIKPQHPLCYIGNTVVVSYSISTSNHNIVWILVEVLLVVSYSISTSNHNRID